MACSFSALTPARVLDTRASLGSSGPVAPMRVVSLKVTGAGGVPTSGVSAVVLNVTVTRPTADGNVQAYPSGTAAPASSSLNFVPGQDVANLVVVKVGPDGRVNLRNYSKGTTQLVADVAGFYR